MLLTSSTFYLLSLCIFQCTSEHISFPHWITSNISHMTHTITTVTWPTLYLMSHDPPYHYCHWPTLYLMSHDPCYHYCHMTYPISYVTWPTLSLLSCNLPYLLYHMTYCIATVTWPTLCHMTNLINLSHMNYPILFLF